MAKIVQAKTLFPFEGSMPGELSFDADEILTITNQDVGDGWWEACNSQSQTGLIPLAYVELLRTAPVDRLPARRNVPCPPVKTSVTNTGVNGENVDCGWTDEEWDDDEDDEPVKTPVSPTNNNNILTSSRSVDNVARVRSERRLSTQATIRNRFSRSGPELFLFDSSVLSNSDAGSSIVIVDGAYGPVWHTTGSAFTCVVASPTTEKKFHGIKTYTAYQLTPSFSNIRISRRYKQFDWLYQRLTEKFIMIAVPPLPDKQITGRFEDEFVNTRLKQLQMWIDRMCKHPVIADSEVFHHFLTCTDPKRWTAGKRKAEKDELTAARVFFNVQSHVKAMDSKTAETRVEAFNRFVRFMDDSVKNLASVGERSIKKHEEAFSKHYRKLGSSFTQLAKSFEYDERPGAKGLTAAVSHTGKTYDEIGQLYAMQPKNDMCDLLNRLHEYHGLLSTFPEIVVSHKSAQAKLLERENSSKLTDSDYETARQRVDLIAHCVLAEADHFNQHRVIDFKDYMQQFLTSQIAFFKKITAKLEDNLRQYE